MSTHKNLLGQYSSQDMDKIIGWGEGQDGDGHLLAEQTAHGRANHLTVDSLFNNVGNGTDSLAYDSPLGVSAAMQYSNCFVNEYGIRFCDESGGDVYKRQTLCCCRVSRTCLLLAYGVETLTMQSCFASNIRSGGGRRYHTV